MSNPHSVYRARLDVPPDLSQQVAALADAETRATFILRTYAHLFAAMAGFVLVEFALFDSGLAANILEFVDGTSWLVLLGGFILVGWLASHTALRAHSRVAQYAALVGFVLAEALLFVPLLTLADQQAPGAIQSAGIVALGGFAGLTLVAFLTRHDFNFLRGVLVWGGFCVLLVIACAVIFEFSLGVWFCGLMVLFAGCAILFDTSRVLRSFPIDRHVGASLSLFASVALLFWYVLRVFVGARD